jgi:predicted nucleic acid-binding protein
VALAACLSKTGASRLIFELAAAQAWELVISQWVLREMRENLADLPLSATRVWLDLRNQLVVEDDELTFDWPLLFHVTKDKPVLCTALACADVLLTLDRRDFGSLLDQSVYDLRVLTPGTLSPCRKTSGAPARMKRNSVSVQRI